MRRVLERFGLYRIAVSLVERLIVFRNSVLALCFRTHPVNPQKVIIDNFNGKGFGENPRYLAEKLIEDSNEWDIVWIVNDESYVFPEGIRKVKRLSKQYAFEQATAKFWVDNVRSNIWPLKRKGQYYIQLWHGEFVLKQIEADTETSLKKSYIQAAKHDGKRTDLIPSVYSWNNEQMRRVFWLPEKTEISHYGTPKYDAFYDEKYVKNAKKHMKTSLGIEENEIVILYAPTFRDNGSTDYYIREYNLLLDAFKQVFNSNCKIVVRMHPNVGDIVCEFCEDKVINGTNYSDMQELALGSDVLITDYSSVMYDFIIQRKPVFLYTEDIDEYRRTRGLYHTFDDLPLPRANSLEELKNCITDFSIEQYNRCVVSYLSINPIENNGIAAKSIISWMMKME